MSYVRTFLLAIVILSASAAVFAETITMSTYYPSPSGNYSNMTNSILTVTDHILFLTGGQSYFAGISGANLYLSAGGAFSAANGIVIGNTGNIGIKKVPTVALDVNGAISSSTLTTGTISATSISTTSSMWTAGSIYVAGSVEVTGTGSLTVSTIRSSGTGIVVKSPLGIDALTSCGQGLQVLNRSQATFSGDLYVIGNIITPDGGTTTIGNNAQVNGALGVTGNVTANAFVYSSDENLKEDIVRITNAIEKIKAINGVYFKYKGKEEQRMGLIAQNVEKVVPEVVVTDANGLKSVDYASLVGLLVEAVKEQQVIIEELQEKDKKNR